MRSPRSAVAAIALALLAATAPSYADPGGAPPELPEQASPTAALAVAERVLSGDARPGDPEPTIALLELRRVVDDLSGAPLARAEELLSPQDGPTTQRRTNRARTCGDHVCVHFVTDRDSPDHATRAWARETRDVLEHSWAVVVDRMGYRAPRRDGDTRGRLDVLLRDQADRLYGFCYPTSNRTVSPGTCVLDNDYSIAEYPSGTPGSNLRVTATHEFFHVVQFAYDSYEDPWMMEASSTWMEERVHDRVDDNRQYLPASQLHRPGRSLDLFGDGLGYYGNWIWFEYLTTQYGARVVRQVWHRAGAAAGMPGEYSIQAIRQVLKRRKGPRFRGVYARFAGANTHPASTYPEGAAYDRPTPARTVTLGPGTRRWSGRFRINHQASRTVRVQPAVTQGRSRLVVRVDGPGRRTAPAVAVTVLRPGGDVRRRLVRLDRSGAGVLRTAFGAGRVQDVSVTPVNASTRYRWCGQGDWTFACEGFPRDQRRRFDLSLRVRG